MNALTKELEKSIQSLRTALKSEQADSDQNDLFRDASIQRFKLCIDLSWKTAKRVMGSSSAAPKAILREMITQGYISDINLWFDFLEARNESSHAYKEEVAIKVYATAKTFLPHGEALIQKLKSV